MIKNLLIIQLLILSTAILITSNSRAQSIDINSLGNLQLKFKPVKKVTHIPSNKIAAKVDVKVGESYVLTTPTNVQQLNYLHANGTLVKKNQPFAILSGPEVHHFLSELETVKSLYELSHQRMKNSQKLFDKKLLEEEKWLEISRNYYTAMLEYEHMMHFYDLVSSIDEMNDSIIIKAPIEGVLTTKNTTGRISEGEVLASFIPEKSIRLKLQIPSNRINNLAYVQLSDCRLKVQTVNLIALDFFVDVWTESIDQSCHLFLGQTALASPFYKQTAYRVLISSVFGFEGNDYILLRKGDQLEAINVSLITAIGQDYLLSTEVDLTGASVLVSSVSAVQGMLLGLGGE